jgi:hypothetical protein
MEEEMLFKLKFNISVRNTKENKFCFSLEINCYFERSKCFQKVHLKASIKLPIMRFIILCKVFTKLYKTEVNTLESSEGLAGFLFLKT